MSSEGDGGRRETRSMGTAQTKEMAPEEARLTRAARARAEATGARTAVEAVEMREKSPEKPREMEREARKEAATTPAKTEGEVVKRGRGRPRKVREDGKESPARSPSGESTAQSEGAETPSVKRGRGRPRKVRPGEKKNAEKEKEMEKGVVSSAGEEHVQNEEDGGDEEETEIHMEIDEETQMTQSEDTQILEGEDTQSEDRTQMPDSEVSNSAMSDGVKSRLVQEESTAEFEEEIADDAKASGDVTEQVVTTDSATQKIDSCASSGPKSANKNEVDGTDASNDCQETSEHEVTGNKMIRARVLLNDVDTGEQQERNVDNHSEENSLANQSEAMLVDDDHDEEGQDVTIDETHEDNETDVMIDPESDQAERSIVTPADTPTHAGTKRHRDIRSGSTNHDDTDEVRLNGEGGDKRRKRTRPRAVVLEQDLAILRAVAAVKPHRAVFGFVSLAWREVVDKVNSTIGHELTELQIKARYNNLQRKESNHTLVAELLQQIQEDRVKHRAELEKQGRGPRGGMSGVVNGKDDQEAVTRSLSRSVPVTRQMTSEARAVTTEVDALCAAADNTESCDRRTFVQTTLLSMADRLVEIENLWAEEARQEREAKADSLGKQQNVFPPAPQAIGDDPIVKDLQEKIERLTSALRTARTHQIDMSDRLVKLSSTVQQMAGEKLQLNTRVATLDALVASGECERVELKRKVELLSNALEASSRESDVLKRSLVSLSMKVDTLSSLSVTATALQKPHMDNEQELAGMRLRQQQMEKENSKQAIEKMHEESTRQISKLQNAVEALRRENEDLVATLKQDREEASARERQWKKDIERKLSSLNEGVESAKRASRSTSGKPSNGHNGDTELRREIVQLRASLQREKEERTRQHDALLVDIREALAGDD